MTKSLIEFFLARLADDEYLAHETLRCSQPEWSLPFSAVVDTGDEDLHTNDSALASYIAHNDPSRVLREVEAKRRILAGFIQLRDDPATRTDPARHLQYNVLRHVIAHLAAIHADHPDYEPEWRP